MKSTKRLVASFFFLAALGYCSVRGAVPRERGTALLQHALTMISGQRFKDAISDLRDFVDRFPNHVYADYAHYWLAFAHYQSHEYALGEVTTDFLLYRYPNSFKRPDALLLNALCRLGRGERERSIDDLRHWIEKYPDASLSRTAEEILFAKESGPRRDSILGSLRSPSQK